MARKNNLSPDAMFRCPPYSQAMNNPASAQTSVKLTFAHDAASVNMG